MCNSNDIVKDGEFFVCQSCGTKYTLESARKLMSDETVTVTVDNSGNFDKYVKLAWEAIDDARYDAAYDNFTKAVEIEPENPECVLGQGIAIYGKNTEQTVPPAAIKCVEKAKRLFDSSPEKSIEKDKIILNCIKKIVEICDNICDPLDKERFSLKSSINKTHYTGWNGGEGQAAILNETISNHNADINLKINKNEEKASSYSNFRRDSLNLLINEASINEQFKYYYDIYGFGTQILRKAIELYPQITLSPEEQKEMLYKDPEKTWQRFRQGYRIPGFIEVYVKMGGDINLKRPVYSYVWVSDIAEGHLKDVEILKELINNGAKMDFDEKVPYYGKITTTMLTNKTNPAIRDYLISKYPEAKRKVNKLGKSGCYVATCVYGSYDCPQVWTLRRYRDHTLAQTRRGRAFIKAYYAISPTLVKWFGNTNWFKKMWKGKLDRMVKRLNDSGIEDTEYQDKNR